MSTAQHIHTIALLCLILTSCAGCQSSQDETADGLANFNTLPESSYWSATTEDFSNVTVTIIKDSRSQINAKYFGPYGTYLDSNYLYVAGLRESRVVRFKASDYSFDGWLNGGSWTDSNFPFSGGSSTQGSFFQPHSISEGCDGNLYITEFGNKRTQLFNKNGTYVSELSNQTTSSQSLNIGKTPSGHHDSSCNFYLVDGEYHRVIKYNSSNQIVGWIGQGTDGNIQTNYNTTNSNSEEGSQLASFSQPHIARVLSTNELLTVDYNHRVQKFNSSGAFVGWIGTTSSSTESNWSTSTAAPTNTTSNGGFSYPVSLDIDSSDNFYVVDYTGHRIQKFNSSGVFIGWMGVNTSGNFTDGWTTSGTAMASSGTGGLRGPTDINVSGDLLIVTDLLNSRVVIYKFKSGTP